MAQVFFEGTPFVHLTVIAETDIGLMREENEDSLHRRMTVSDCCGWEILYP